MKPKKTRSPAPRKPDPDAPPGAVRITPEMLGKKAPVAIAAGVVQQIHRHARSSMGAEVCGVLIGEECEGITAVEAAIEGERASQGGAHVTFTQDTWEHIYAVKDKAYPEKRIVGWYHSHPGFGIFLSQHDLFIHENFFSAPCQIAWVYDPHSDEEGCFGWVDGKVKRLSEVRVLKLGADEAPVLGEEPEEIPELEDQETAPVKPSAKDGEIGQRSSHWRNRLLILLSLGVMFAAGLAAGVFLYPRSLVMYSLPDGRILTEEQMRIAVERALEIRKQELEQKQSPAPETSTPPGKEGSRNP